MANAFNFARRSQIPSTDGPPILPPGEAAPTAVHDPDWVIDSINDTTTFELKFTNTGAASQEYNVYLGPVSYSFIPNLDQSTFSWRVSNVNGFYYHYFRYDSGVDNPNPPIGTGTQITIRGGRPTNTPGASDPATVVITD